MSTSKQNFSKKSTVPKLRFKEFRDPWIQKKMGDVCKIKHGFAFKGEYFDDSGPYIVLTPGNFDVENGGFRYQGENEKYYTDDSFPKEYILSKGDLLTVMTEQAAGLIGCPLIIPKSGIFLHNQRLGLFQVSSNVKREFLFHMMKTSAVNEKFSKTAAGTKVRHTSPQLIEGIVISMPLENEQQKIASFLSAVDKKIKQLTRKKELLEQYKKGVMQQLFSGKFRFKDENGKAYPKWEEKRLDEIAEFRRGSFPQPYGLPKWYDPENGFPFVQVFDVDDNMLLKPATKVKISRLAAEQSVFVRKGSLVITIQGSIGRIAKTQYDTYVDRTLLIFQSFNQPVDIDYFKYVVYLLFEIEKTKAPGGTIKTITKEALSSFKIMLPQLEEQQKIASFLSIIDSKIESVSNQLKQTQTFKKGLLQQMFV